MFRVSKQISLTINEIKQSICTISTFLGRREENQVHLIPSRASPPPDEVPIRPGVRKNGQDQRQIRVPRKP
jgi:hypothetical protein